MHTAAIAWLIKLILAKSLWHHSLDFNSTAYEFAQIRFQSLAKRAKCKDFELNSTHYYGKMHTNVINQKKYIYLFVVKINNHHFWVNTKSIQCFSNAFFSNVRSNLALYFKLKTTIISRKVYEYVTYVALPKNPSVWKVWKFSDKGQYKITLALGHKYEVKTLSLPLCLFQKECQLQKEEGGTFQPL